MAERIEFANFSVRYPASATSALSAIFLEIPAGTCCAVLGPTGAGKTSLLHVLAGTLGKHHPGAIASGSLRIGERSFAGLPRQILFPGVGLVLQDPYVQISGIRDTVYDEILFTLENTGMPGGDPAALIEPLLQRLGIAHLQSRKPTTLSGGETQRVALATILIADPAILLLDEPTSALDSKAQEQLHRLLRSLKGKRTIIFTDAQIDFALQVCDLAVVLDKGEIVFTGTPFALLEQLQRFSRTLPTSLWLEGGSGIPSLLNASSRGQSRIAQALNLK